MFVVGVFLAHNAQPYSWRQLEAIAFIFIGIGVFIHGIKKLRAKSIAETSCDEK
jgi:hypothetical protein